ncbi:hypothetical protein [Nostoc sp.]|uniref:hypothetical protein n=1 Tax=Nostoc sp. TaxID=1180 RepID=UPI002FF652FD
MTPKQLAFYKALNPAQRQRLLEVLIRRSQGAKGDTLNPKAVHGRVLKGTKEPKAIRKPTDAC